MPEPLILLMVLAFCFVLSVKDRNILTYFFLFYNHFFVFPGSPNRVRGNSQLPLFSLFLPGSPNPVRGNSQLPLFSPFSQVLRTGFAGTACFPFFRLSPGFSQPGSREQPASPFFAFPPGFSQPGSRKQPASPFFLTFPGFSQPGSREQPASPFFAFFPGSPNPVRRYRYSEKKVAPLAGCDPDCFYFNLNIELFIVVYNITKFCLKRCSTYKTSVDVWLSE